MYKKNNTNLILSLILIIVTLFSLLTIYASSTAHSAAAFSISARSAILYEGETDTTLYEKNINERLPMASTTKIMTAIIALENSSLSDTVTVDEDAVGIEGSSAYLRAGDEVTMEELIYALLLQSANDAASAIAIHIAGSIEAFADMMNEKAESLGLCDTKFKNPHGLDDKEHYTTAHDLAKIAAYALSDDTFKTITSTYKKTFNRGESARVYVNHNKLLNLYDGCIGVKTGFTRKSGRCLVSAAVRDELTFITVTLDAPNDWRDHSLLLDYGFDTLMKINFVKDGGLEYEIPVIGGDKSSLIAINQDEKSLILKKDEYEIKEYVKLPRYVVAPISEGEVLGEVIYTVDGEKRASVKIVSTENVRKPTKKRFLSKLFS